MARTFKKIGIRLLLGLFRGLVFLKRLLKAILFFVKEPFFWMYGVLLKPLLTSGYLFYRRIKRVVDAVVEPARDRAMSVLANKYSIHVVVTLIAFLVSASNLYAKDAYTMQELDRQHSILASIVLGEEEDVVVDEQGVSAEDTTYLASQAISAYEASYVEEYNGTDDGLYIDDESELGYVSPFGTSVSPNGLQEDHEQRPPTRSSVEYYVVQPGDTVGVIARRFGISANTLLAANGLTARSYIQPGQSLKVLPYDGILYKVKSGDTVAKIAQTYSTETAKVLEANGLASASALKVGSEIILPDGRAPAPPPPKRPAQIATNIKKVITPGPSPDRTSSGMIWPTAARRITQYWRGRLHTGVDIAGPTGTAIYAADDGVVAVAGWNSGGYGNMLLVDHGGGIFTRYAHASKNLVQVGDTVKKGDTIALMGSTGRSTGPHLHFEVMTRTTSNRVNPLDYVR